MVAWPGGRILALLDCWLGSNILQYMLAAFQGPEATSPGSPEPRKPGLGRRADEVLVACSAESLA